MEHPFSPDHPEPPIDEIDRRLISLLNQNGRASYTDLAKEVGLSRVAVQTRIQALMENGTIERFACIVNPEKMGIAVSAFFNVEVEPKFLMQAAELLAEEPEVTSLYHMSGPSKLHMHGLFVSHKEMESFLQNKLYRLEGITSVDCQVLIKRYKSRMGMRL
ncbi:Lrp/AsnC family transcriptional regulator [Paenibacillus aurantius]|uniref:Lrp/AsnC family transcriptional regulator n=1 Tax=Paenibacillus aurantius TaxID=2918900 RepID=A0AA96REY6_9BACL|nr:Lrp/AsnC family transcriptional regulator [Paenibacillus aurantius]WNQ10708.1 Lrp/AsnC family transcriptional regulator [Paenibacillus aurantius]